jgi:DNA-binding CsgD family transcriptional regulator
VAVLGDGAGLSEAAALAGIPGERAAAAVAGLTRAAILEDEEDALGFAHPIARAAVYAEIGPHRRAEMHAAAARLRAGAGESAELVAAQLAHAAPGEVDGARDILAAAADQALDRGAPDAAATYLRRALREPLDEPRRAAFSARLGHAAARAGLPEAVDELRRAIDLALDPRRRAATALELGHLLAARGESAAAVELLGGHARDLAADAPAAAARLEAELLAIGDADLGARALALAQAPGLLGDDGFDSEPNETARARAQSRRGDDRSRPGDDRSHEDPIDAMLLVHRATEATMAARGAEEAADLARRALGHGTLLAAGMSGAQLAFLAAYFLLCADRFAEAERFYDGALDAARRAGSGVGFASASAGRAYVALQRGRLGDAESDARAALDMARATGVRLIELLSASLLGLALSERGAARKAADEIERLELGERDADIVQGTGAVVTRGQARIALGDVEGGVADLLAAGERLTAIGLVNPASFPWRSAAAGGLAALGRREEAAALAADEVALARRWGAPRALAVALRAEGALTRSIEPLREAVAVLDGSEAVLERARALTELGAALRRSGRRSEARDPLRIAIELAGECGAAPLADRARTELRAAGGRPRAPLRTGVDALTASERRIAEMAAAGRSNPEIAQDLFVTVKTVEMHLSGAYRKLGIRSRSQLPGVLTVERSSALPPESRSP